jgi:hypothetical protein
MEQVGAKGQLPGLAKYVDQGYLKEALKDIAKK